MSKDELTKRIVVAHKVLLGTILITTLLLLTGKIEAAVFVAEHLIVIIMVVSGYVLIEIGMSMLFWFVKLVRNKS